MIKTTVGTIVRATQTGAFGRFLSCERPAPLAWKNRKLAAALNVELGHYNTARVELCEKFCRKDEEGKAVKDPSGNYLFDNEEKTTLIIVNPGPQRTAFQLAHDELLKREVDDLPGDAVKISDLSGSLSTADCELLADAFITD